MVSRKALTQSRSMLCSPLSGDFSVGVSGCRSPSMLCSPLSGASMAATDGGVSGRASFLPRLIVPHSLGVIRLKKKQKQMHKLQESLKPRRLGRLAAPPATRTWGLLRQNSRLLTEGEQRFQR